jgi:hypothetical protein
MLVSSKNLIPSFFFFFFKVSCLDKGHCGVKVFVLKVDKQSAQVRYITPGWKEEAVGTTAEVERKRLRHSVPKKWDFEVSEEAHTYIQRLLAKEIVTPELLDFLYKGKSDDDKSDDGKSDDDSATEELNPSKLLPQKKSTAKSTAPELPSTNTAASTTTPGKAPLAKASATKPKANASTTFEVSELNHRVPGTWMSNWVPIFLVSFCNCSN